MSAKTKPLSKIFQDLEYNPFNPMSLANHTYKCISHFAQDFLQTSDSLYHLGIITAYENYFGDPRGFTKPIYQQASQNAQQAFLTDTVNLSERLFLNKIEEQQALRDTEKLLGFLKHHRPNYRDEIDEAVEAISHTINNNEFLLESVFSDNVAFYQNLNRRSKLIRPMHEYKKYIPKTEYVSPINLHEIVPILQKRCINIATTTQASCDTQFLVILNQIGIFRAFAKHGKYTDLEHVTNLDTISEDMQHQAISESIYNSYIKSTSHLKNANDINSMIVTFTSEIFPKHGNLIGVKNPPPKTQPHPNFK